MTSRRSFLRTAAVGGSILGLQSLQARSLGATPARFPADRVGYGRLVPTPASNTGETLLALPEGFAYTVFGRTGEIMSDGRPTPPMHDGMAAFAHGSRVRLVRNHESYPRTLADAVSIGAPARSWDPRANGGTTTLTVDPRTRLPLEAFVSLSGTIRNCAGGPTPWASWISCEEAVAGEAQGFERPHGYCFDVPVAAQREADPVALRAMGRFVHEAVAVDPATGIVYETEDALAAGFYRFLPAEGGRLAAGGQLEMLAIAGRPGYDTRTGQRTGVPLEARWVPIADPDPSDAAENPAAVFAQGAAGGGAIFGRLEGCWQGGGHIYFNATSGGNAGMGQVWQYRPAGDAGGEVILLFESPSAAVLQSPDNICVSPRGGLLLCEDGAGENYLRGLTRDGRIFDFALNLHPASAEFAGATFSPDGQTLFLNVQAPGLTCAIWGDWGRGEL